MFETTFLKVIHDVISGNFCRTNAFLKIYLCVSLHNYSITYSVLQEFPTLWLNTEPEGEV